MGNSNNILQESMLRVGTVLRGIYRIESYLSSGGFGNTYVATNIEFNERYAIKEFFMKGITQRDGNSSTVSISNSINQESFSQQKEKFKKEARRLRQLNNPHIVKVHDLFEENGTAYYVMDYVDGENLNERLKRTGLPMSEEEVNIILPQLLDALKAVHDAGMWHLDIKPANIMLDKAGNVKLIDFGASKQLNTQKGGATTSTAISYTNGFAPREQMEQNYDKFGPWTDIYALGATLYNLLTNKRPPLPTDIDDDMSEDKHVALPFLTTTSKEMKNLVLQMMKANRAERPKSIDELSKNSLLNCDNHSEESEKKNKRTHLEETITQTPQSEDTIFEPISKSTQQPFSSETNQTFYDEPIESKNSLGKIIGCIFAGLFVLFFIYIVFVNTGTEELTETNTHKNEEKIKEVDDMHFETAIGDCEYSGPINEKNNPNGIGRAFFNDGRYYRGSFKDGVLTGNDAYFKYPNGDEFTGKFRNNSFYYGTYTIAADRSYFTGYFEKGKPSNGNWYDKNGNIITNSQ